MLRRTEGSIEAFGHDGLRQFFRDLLAMTSRQTSASFLVYAAQDAAFLA
jgi:hypothetical protein